jgi:hypothetical protein
MARFCLMFDLTAAALVGCALALRASNKENFLDLGSVEGSMTAM